MLPTPPYPICPNFGIMFTKNSLDFSAINILCESLLVLLLLFLLDFHLKKYVTSLRINLKLSKIRRKFCFRFFLQTFHVICTLLSSFHCKYLSSSTFRSNVFFLLWWSLEHLHYPREVQLVHFLLATTTKLERSEKVFTNP